MPCVQPKSIQTQQEDAGTPARCPFSSPVQQSGRTTCLRPQTQPSFVCLPGCGAGVKGSCGSATGNHVCCLSTWHAFHQGAEQSAPCLATCQAMFKLLSTSVKRKVGIRMLDTPSHPKARLLLNSWTWCRLLHQ